MKWNCLLSEIGLFKRRCVFHETHSQIRPQVINAWQRGKRNDENRVEVCEHRLADDFRRAPGKRAGAAEPGRSIGTISTQGDLIVMTLNEDALGKANLFDLVRRTLRFTPQAGIQDFT